MGLLELLQLRPYRQVSRLRLPSQRVSVAKRAAEDGVLSSTEARYLYTELHDFWYKPSSVRSFKYSDTLWINDVRLKNGKKVSVFECGFVDPVTADFPPELEERIRSENLRVEFERHRIDDVEWAEMLWFVKIGYVLGKIFNPPKIFLSKTRPIQWVERKTAHMRPLRHPDPNNFRNFYTDFHYYKKVRASVWWAVFKRNLRLSIMDLTQFDVKTGYWVVVDDEREQQQQQQRFDRAQRWDRAENALLDKARVDIADSLDALARLEKPPSSMLLTSKIDVESVAQVVKAFARSYRLARDSEVAKGEIVNLAEEKASVEALVGDASRLAESRLDYDHEALGRRALEIRDTASRTLRKTIKQAGAEEIVSKTRSELESVAESPERAAKRAMRILAAKVRPPS